MGTHPIFESDFDCLTDNGSKMPLNVLYESPVGFALFSVLDEGKFKEVSDVQSTFADPSSLGGVLQLKKFKKFTDQVEATGATVALTEGKIAKPLKKMLKKLAADEVQAQLAVADSKLGGIIRDSIGLECIHSPAIHELIRGIRENLNEMTGIQESERSAMALGLAHSLSRYKLKFSPDKVDTMIVQAISLLDDLDKELNNYTMRVREWYGWHFPDMGNILQLANQVIEITDYRAQLFEYLKNRMAAIAPNLTVLVGELVGARLIAHAGSLLNLAKHPASTVQILGAEKALFRALKTKQDTPEYGLIYHASMVGQAAPKNKGKVSRMLAAKAALAIRYDALAEGQDEGLVDFAIEARTQLEKRARELELRKVKMGGPRGKTDKYKHKSEVVSYDGAKDQTIKRKSEKEEGVTPAKKVKKEKAEVKEEPTEESMETEETPTKSKKDKKKKKKKTKEEAEE